jgi:hypothetical protein
VIAAVTLGGLAALLALWQAMTAIEGVGYAFPLRPSVVVPQRWAVGARVLVWTIVLGLAASFIAPLAVGETAHVSAFHIIIGLGLIVPIWDQLAARMYGDSFVILNGRADVVRPVALAAVAQVFGPMDEDRNFFYSQEKPGEDFQIIIHERPHLLVLDPTFKIDKARRRALEESLAAALKKVKSSGFNEPSFWISFVLPLLFGVVCAGIAYFVLQPIVQSGALHVAG